MTLLRLRCIRCGAWMETEPTEGLADICPAPCWAKGQAILFAPGPRARQQARFVRWLGRARRGADRHPTTLALTAALGKMESTPHGTLEVGDEA
jgi:hypothetical protein